MATVEVVRSPLRAWDSVWAGFSEPVMPSQTKTWLRSLPPAAWSHRWGPLVSSLLGCLCRGPLSSLLPSARARGLSSRFSPLAILRTGAADPGSLLKSGCLALSPGRTCIWRPLVLLYSILLFAVFLILYHRQLGHFSTTFSWPEPSAGWQSFLRDVDESWYDDGSQAFV